MKFNKKLRDALIPKEVVEFITAIPNLKHKAFVALMYSASPSMSEMHRLRYKDTGRKRGSKFGLPNHGVIGMLLYPKMP